MQYVNLGQAGVKVSRIALGMGLRGIGDAAEAARFVEYAIDRGVNFIDCANRYGLLDNRVDARGTSEQALSRVLKTRRDDVVLTTKVRGPMGDGPNDAGTSRYHILREIDRSLARLGTDHVDIYLLHGLDAETPMDETLRALDDIVTQGKARYVGCCNYQAWQVCKSLWGADRLGTDPFVCVQNMYNMLNCSLENEMFPFLRDSGLGLMVYSPLAIGLLSGHYRPGQSPPQRLALEPVFPGRLRPGVPDAGRRGARRARRDRRRQGSHGGPGRPKLGALSQRGDRRDHRQRLGRASGRHPGYAGLGARRRGADQAR